MSLVERGVLPTIFLLASVFSSPALAEHKGVSPQSLNLPTGPATISGLGEKYEPLPATGGFNFSLPLKLPTGTAGHAPNLSIDYLAGGGNGSLGLDWQIPSHRITLDLDHGVPQHDGSDELRIEALGYNERLIQIDDDVWRAEADPGMLRVERLRQGWLVRSPTGERFYFGTTDNAREADPNDSARIFSWLLDRHDDVSGNSIRYNYFGDGGVRYLSTVSYAYVGDRALQQIAFDYEDRPDIISGFRRGFESTFGLRIASIRVLREDELVRQYSIEYAEPTAHDVKSRLTAITLYGADGVTQMPTISFRYTTFEPHDQFVEQIAGAPGLSPDEPGVALVDVNADGLTDIVRTRQGALEYALNSGGAFRVFEAVDRSPTVDLGAPETRMLDLDADGMLDIIARAPGANQTLAFMGTGREKVPFDVASAVAIDPTLVLGDPDVRMVDIDGDRDSDFLRVTAERALFHRVTSGGDVGAAERVLGARGWSLMDAGTHLADINGDGLQDLARISRNHLEWLPAEGHGSFEELRSIAFSMALDDEMLRLAQLDDVNGDGLADLIILGEQQLILVVQRGDNSFGDPVVVDGLPAAAGRLRTTRFDVNGNGSSDIVWADPAGGVWYSLDLVGRQRPGLLTQIGNGMGRTTHLEYGTSGHLAAQAAMEGEPWSLPMPISVPVITSVVVDDGLGTQEARTLHYRNGYYDGDRRVFRGFETVRIVDRGPEAASTAVAWQRYDVGVLHPSLRGKLQGEDISDGDGRLLRRTRSTWSVLGEGVGAFAVRNEEIAEHVEGSERPRHVLTRWFYDVYGNVIREENWGEVRADGVDVPGDERFSLRGYAIDIDRWLLRSVARETVEDAAGRVISESRYFYDGEAHRGLPLGIVERGLLTRIEKPVLADGGLIQERRIARDLRGLIVEEIDGNGVLRSFEWDAAGQYPLSEAIHMPGRDTAVPVEDGPAAYVLRFRAEYDPIQGVVTRFVDPNGSATRFGHDALGRIASITPPGVETPTQWFTYELGSPWSKLRIHRRSQEDDVFDAVTCVDGLGRVRVRRNEAEPDPVDGRARHVVTEATLFDSRGETAFQYSPQFVTEDSECDVFAILERQGEERLYDALGRLRQLTHPDDGVERTEYRPLETVYFDQNDTDPDHPHASTPKRILIDGIGNQVEIVESLGDREVVTRHQYDPLGRLTRTIDPMGNERLLEYDWLGRLQRQVHPDAGEIRYEHDAVGNLIRRIDGAGKVVETTFDGAGRPLRTIADQVSITRYYDFPMDDVELEQAQLAGRLSGVRDDAGTLALTYDERGRATRERRWFRLDDNQASRPYDIGFMYDDMDRLIEKSLPSGRQLGFEYGVRDLQTRVLLDGDEIGYVSDYNAAGKPEGIDYGNGVQVKQGYDDRWRLISQRVTSRAGAQLHSRTYRYDRRGNLERGTTDGSDETFSYDALDRLSEARQGDHVQAWSWSDVGTLLRHEDGDTVVDMAYGETAGPHAMTRHSNFGRLNYDEAGNLIGFGDRRLTYDGQNRLIGVVSPILSEAYHYDHEGTRRVVISQADSHLHTNLYIDPHHEVRGDTAFDYVTLDDVRIARFEAYDSEREASIHWLLWALAALLVLLGLCRQPAVVLASLAAIGCDGSVGPVSTLDGGWETPADENGVAVYFVRDHLGSTSLVLSANAEVLESTQTGVFGETSSRSRYAHYTFEGKEFDRTGAYYYGARYYLPELMRWNRVDPLLLDNPTAGLARSTALDPYSFEENNPTTNLDPNGLWIESALDIASLAIGIASIASWDSNTSLTSKVLDVAGVVVDSVALALPLIPGGAGAGLKTGRALETTGDALKGGETTLWRAVKPDELADIQSSGQFINRGSAEGKYFSTTAEGASSYAKQAVEGFNDPPYTLVKTTVPSSVVPPPVSVDRGIPAVVIPDSQLPTLVPDVQNWMPIPR